MYHKYKKLWNKQFSKKLADYAPWDYKIDLELGISLKFFPMYKLTETEINTERVYPKKFKTWKDQAFAVVNRISSVICIKEKWEVQTVY